MLRDLNLRTKETVHLAILQETRAISIEKFDSPQPVGLDARLGGIMPLHCTGVGKTLLAYQSEELLNQIAQSPGLPRMTAHTITGLPQLRKELERIREQGYAVDQEEAVEGLSCVAGPIFNHTGQVVAAFSVAGPATRFTPARIPEIAQMVRETSQQISYRLGYRGDPRRPAGNAGGNLRAERSGHRGPTGNAGWNPELKFFAGGAALSLRQRERGLRIWAQSSRGGCARHTCFWYEAGRRPRGCCGRFRPF